MKSRIPRCVFVFCGGWRHEVAARHTRHNILLAACAVALSLPSGASTIERKSLSDLVKSAELVFEGEVTASTVVPGPVGRPPQTCVTFKVLDVIAGVDPGARLDLCFMGGEVDGERTVVTDLTYPTVGEHGIYIAESTHQKMVNPLAGWDQGHFLVEKDPVGGANKVLTARRRPLLGMAAEAGLPTASKALAGDGVAGGVIAGSGPDLTSAMARDTFKAWLKAAR